MRRVSPHLCCFFVRCALKNKKQHLRYRCLLFKCCLYKLPCRLLLLGATTHVRRARLQANTANSAEGAVVFVLLSSHLFGPRAKTARGRSKRQKLAWRKEEKNTRRALATMPAALTPYDAGIAAVGNLQASGWSGLRELSASADPIELPLVTGAGRSGTHSVAEYLNHFSIPSVRGRHTHVTWYGISHQRLLPLMTRRCTRGRAWITSASAGTLQEQELCLRAAFPWRNPATSR